MKGKIDYQLEGGLLLGGGDYQSGSESFPRGRLGDDEFSAGAFPKLGLPFGGPYNKDVNTLGSILGSPYFRTLPVTSQA